MNKVISFICFVVLFGFMTASHSSDATDVFSDSGVAALATAAADGNIKKIDELIAAEVQVNARGKNGVTPLMWALYHLNKQGFEALLTHKADPNLQEDDGESVMQWASQLKDPEYLKLAIQHGGNPNLLNTQSAYDMTPLFSAIQVNAEANIELLIKAGANLNIQSPTGTPLIASISPNYYHIAYTLLLAGADYKMQSKSGRTAAWYIENGNIDSNSEEYQWRQKVIEFLSQHGVAVTAKPQVAMCSKDLGNGTVEIAPCNKEK